MENTKLRSLIILLGSGIMMSCNSTNRLTNKNQAKVFTAEQIKEKLLKVRTGKDFPVLAMDLKNIGITYYETKMEDGSSIYRGQNDYELLMEANHETIEIADHVNLEQLKLDIANHQQGKSDYLGISRQCAANGIEKWAVSLTDMTCTYLAKGGKSVWVEHIPDVAGQQTGFTVDQLKAAHGKVKSGADFPAYIKEIKALGVIHYETYVSDGHTDYHGPNHYTVKMPAKYDPLAIADTVKRELFKTELQAHQHGKTDYLTFIKMCATAGIEKWIIRMDKMTCTYYDKAGNEILVEAIPQ